MGSAPKWGATKFGFDYSYGSFAGGVNPWNHLYKTGPYSETWHRNDIKIKEEGHATDLFTREAKRFIEANHEKPFFLYLPYTAVHTPFDEPKQWVETAKHVAPERQQYVACLQHFDHAVGEVVSQLENYQLMENTIILFFSDNGGTKGDDSKKYPGSTINSPVKGLNNPLRGWKMQLHEGGVRVPAFIHWKGHLTPHKNKSLIHVSDWMPTFQNSLAIHLPKT